MSETTKEKFGFSLVPDPKDNSTWLGIAVAALGALLGYDHPAAAPEFLAGAVAVVAGVIGIFRKKKG